MALSPGVSGYEGRVEDALELKSKDLWFCFCKNSTPWPDGGDTDETKVPSHLPADADVDEPYLFVKAEYKSIARVATEEEYDAVDPSARILIRTGGSDDDPEDPPIYVRYLFIADADAYENDARWVYARTAIDASGAHPMGSFRTIKMYSGLTPGARYEGATWLLPENVEDRGVFRWGRNFTLVTASSTIKWTTHVVIEKR